MNSESVKKNDEIMEYRWMEKCTNRQGQIREKSNCVKKGWTEWNCL